METSAFTHLDGKLSAIAKDIADTRVSLASLSERAATKEDTEELRNVLIRLAPRVLAMEDSVREVRRFQQTCPAVSEGQYLARRRAEKSQNRKVLFSAISSALAVLAAAGTLYQTIFAKPQAAVDPSKTTPAAIVPPAPQPKAQGQRPRTNP